MDVLFFIGYIDANTNKQVRDHVIVNIPYIKTLNDLDNITKEQNIDISNKVLSNVKNALYLDFYIPRNINVIFEKLNETYLLLDKLIEDMQVEIDSEILTDIDYKYPDCTFSNLIKKWRNNVIQIKKLLKESEEI